VRRRRESVERVSAGFDRLPIRVRLAAVSALLTFVILCAFALAIGSLTVHRIRADFNRQVSETARELVYQSHITFSHTGKIETPLVDFTTSHAVVKILSEAGSVLAEEPKNSLLLGTPNLSEAVTVHGYLVISHLAAVRLQQPDGPELGGRVIIQYGRPVAPTEATARRVELFLGGYYRSDRWGNPFCFHNSYIHHQDCQNTGIYPQLQHHCRPIPNVIHLPTFRWH
jgi:hypothetical protein